MVETLPRYQMATDLLGNWKEDVLTGTPPILYPVGTDALGRIEVGPGLITLLGGAPGEGKTALGMQMIIDALRLNRTLRVVVANVEMSTTALLDRQLARLSGIDLSTIRHRRLGAAHADRIERAINTLEAIADRLCFLGPPYDLANVAATADEFRADLLLLDYIQRITPPGRHGDRRGSIDASMSFLRLFADAGIAVLVVAAVARSKDSKGRSSYREGLNLASFRESSELEFGADDAFMVGRGKIPETVRLQHLKSRHGEPQDLDLRFLRDLQRFEPITAPAPRSDGGKPSLALTELWDRTAPAGPEVTP